MLETAPRLQLAGLMTMAPYVSDPEQVRPVFAKLRELRDELREKFMLDKKKFFRLSMGMSVDFEVAAQEGATDVRVGSILFEGLL
ncbi:MAG: alanine racemase [Planctomycetota bacterium]|nr:alanine racemase [Planctomycetota bacterium]